MKPRVLIYHYNDDVLFVAHTSRRTVTSGALRDDDDFVIASYDGDDSIQAVEILGVSDMSAERWRAAFNPEITDIPHDLYEAVLDWLRSRGKTEL